MKSSAIVMVTILSLGVGLAIFWGAWLKPRALGHYWVMEWEARAEFADKASSLPCAELRLFALTNHLAFLQDHRDLLLMQTNDFNYAVLLTHGRLFNLYRRMSNEVTAEEHFLAASNSFHLLRAKPLQRELLLTNVVFKIEK